MRANSRMNQFIGESQNRIARGARYSSSSDQR
jgi:hypothetical protein